MESWQLGTKCTRKILLSLLFFVLSSPASEAADDSEWLISTSHVGAGKYVYFISANAIKLENTANGACVLSKAPTWRISCYRNSDKLEFTTDLHHFDYSAIFSLMSKHTPVLSNPKKLSDRELVKGLPCAKYGYRDGSRYWTPADLQTEPQVAEVVARNFRTSCMPFVPVRILKAAGKSKPGDPKRPISTQENRNSTVPWTNYESMDLTSAERLSVDLIDWKRVPYKASDFEYPKGFEQTTDLKDVIIPAMGRKEFLKLFKD